LAELRNLSAEKLMEAAKNKPGIPFSPVVDGQFLVESVPETYAAGRQAHVPAIIGWIRDERAGTLSKDMTVAKWKAHAAEHYGKRANELLAAFAGNIDEQAARSADDFRTDIVVDREGETELLLRTVARQRRPAIPTNTGLRRR
jgi:para-nitrobenzyl esterase